MQQPLNLGGLHQMHPLEYDDKFMFKDFKPELQFNEYMQNTFVQQ